MLCVYTYKKKISQYHAYLVSVKPQHIVSGAKI